MRERKSRRLRAQLGPEFFAFSRRAGSLVELLWAQVAVHVRWYPGVLEMASLGVCSMCGAITLSTIL